MASCILPDRWKKGEKPGTIEKDGSKTADTATPLEKVWRSIKSAIARKKLYSEVIEWLWITMRAFVWLLKTDIKIKILSFLQPWTEGGGSNAWKLQGFYLKGRRERSTTSYFVAHAASSSKILRCTHFVQQKHCYINRKLYFIIHSLFTILNLKYDWLNIIYQHTFNAHFSKLHGFNHWS
jgi:hypothetical protein